MTLTNDAAVFHCRIEVTCFPPTAKCGIGKSEINESEKKSTKPQPNGRGRN